MKVGNVYGNISFGFVILLLFSFQFNKELLPITY